MQWDPSNLGTLGTIPSVLLGRCPDFRGYYLGLHSQCFYSRVSLPGPPDANREQVLACGGCPLLVDLLALCPSLPAHQENVRLKAVACGCLLNVANQNGRTIIKDLQLANGSFSCCNCY